MTKEQLLNGASLAVDTEFVWNRTYYAKLGLIQLCPGGSIGRDHISHLSTISFTPQNSEEAESILVDPFTTDPALVKQLLEDESIVKILHDSLQDLQHLSLWCGALPKNIFDTRVAAGFCGLSASISLQKLLMATLGLELPKSETVSNWCARPLSDSQVRYAAQDVAYCRRCMLELIKRAESFGTLEYMLEEMSTLDNPDKIREQPVENARIHLPSHFSADPLAHLRAKELAIWREKIARTRNLPRRWVADDSFLIIAATTPSKIPANINKRDLAPAFCDSFFKTLHRCATLTPTSPIPTPEQTPDGIRDTIKGIQSKIAAKAESMHIDPILVATKADIIAYILTPDDPTIKLNRGWRRIFRP